MSTKSRTKTKSSGLSGSSSSQGRSSQAQSKSPSFTTTTQSKAPKHADTSRHGKNTGSSRSRRKGVTQKTAATSSNKPQRLKSTLDSALLSLPFAISPSDCEKTQVDIRQERGVSEFDSCLCGACGGDVRNHDEGLQPLSKLADDYEDESEEDSPQKRHTHKKRGRSKHKKTHRGREPDPDVEEEFEPDNFKMCGSDVSVSSPYDDGAHHSHHDTKGAEGNKSQPPKRSSLGRSHHVDGDDERSRSRHNSSRRRGSSQSSSSNVPRLAVPVPANADAYARVRVASKNGPWSPTQVLNGRKKRLENRAALKNATVSSTPKNEQPQPVVSPPILQKIGVGEKQKEGAPIDLVSPDTINAVAPYPVVGEKAQGPNFDHLSIYAHLPRQFILSRDNEGHYLDRNTEIFNQRVAQLRRSVEVAFVNAITSTPVKNMKKDYKKYFVMELEGDTSDENSLREIRERIAICPMSMDASLNSIHETDESKTMIHGCEICGVRVKRHPPGKPCGLSREEVKLNFQHGTNFRCIVCSCVADAHNPHNHSAQQEAGNHEIIDKNKNNDNTVIAALEDERTVFETSEGTDKTEEKYDNEFDNFDDKNEGNDENENSRRRGESSSHSHHVDEISARTDEDVNASVSVSEAVFDEIPQRGKVVGENSPPASSTSSSSSSSSSSLSSQCFNNSKNTVFQNKNNKINIDNNRRVITSKSGKLYMLTPLNEPMSEGAEHNTSKNEKSFNNNNNYKDDKRSSASSHNRGRSRERSSRHQHRRGGGGGDDSEGSSGTSSSDGSSDRHSSDDDFIDEEQESSSSSSGSSTSRSRSPQPHHTRSKTERVKQQVKCLKFLEEFPKEEQVVGQKCEDCKFLVLAHNRKPKCMFALQDFPVAHLATETCSACRVLIDLHERRPDLTKIGRYDPKAFPLFKIGVDDPFEFLKKFERQLFLQNQSQDRWNYILEDRAGDQNTQRWVNENISKTWLGEKGMRESFIRHVIPGDYEDNLRKRLAKLRNTDVTELQAYFREFRELCYLLGYDFSDKKIIKDCERNLCIQAKYVLQQYRLTYYTITGQITHSFQSLDELERHAVVALRDVTALPLKSGDFSQGTYPNKGKSRKRKQSGSSQGVKALSVDEIQAIAVQAATAIVTGQQPPAKSQQRSGSRKPKRQRRNKNAPAAQAVTTTTPSTTTQQQPPVAQQVGPTNNSGQQSGNSRGKRGGRGGFRGGRGGRGGNQAGGQNANQSQSTTPSLKGRCFACHETGHLIKDCPHIDFDKIPKACYTSIPILNNLKQIDRNFDTEKINLESEQKIMLAKLAAGGQQLYEILADSGAQLSLISKRLVKQLRLHVFKPTGPKFIQLADKSQVHRKGFVVLPLTVLFPGTERKPVVLRQQFEIMNIAPHFIFGTDVLPSLFKNDEFTKYMVPHASITSKPTLSTSEVADENDMDIEEKENSVQTEKVEETAQAVESIPISYAFTDEEIPTVNNTTNQKHKKLDLSVMNSYDQISKTVRQKIDSELQEMQKQMESLNVEEENNMQLDEENISEGAREAALRAMQEYLESHNIRMTGPWKSTSGSRVQRHIQ